MPASLRKRSCDVLDEVQPGPGAAFESLQDRSAVGRDVRNDEGAIHLINGSDLFSILYQGGWRLGLPLQFQMITPCAFGARPPVDHFFS